MRRLMLASAVTALLMVPSVADAQACFGVPQGSRAVFALGMGFPSHAKVYQASGVAKVGEGGAFVGASYSLWSPDADGVKNSNIFGGQAAYELSGLVESASVCPNVGLAYESWGEFKTTQIPVGLSIGKTFPVGDRSDVTLTPSVTPQFVWARMKAFGDSESDTFFGMDGGATLGIGRFLIRGSVAKIFEEGADAVFSITFGLSL